MVGDIEENIDGSPAAMAAPKTKNPSQWLKSYGDGHLKLQIFAIHVLSWICCSSGF